MRSSSAWHTHGMNEDTPIRTDLSYQTRNLVLCNTGDFEFLALLFIALIFISLLLVILVMEFIERY